MQIHTFECSKQSNKLMYSEGSVFFSILRWGLLPMKLYLFGFTDYYTSDEEFGNSINSISDINSLSTNPNHLLARRPYLSARRFSDIVTKFPIVHSSSDSEYEQILLRNIKLWKDGQLENDSVFVWSYFFLPCRIISRMINQTTAWRKRETLTFTDSIR